MRLKVLFVMVAACVAFMATESFAVDTCYVAPPDTCGICRKFVRPDTAFGVITSVDLGVCDTVRIGCPVCVNGLGVGDSIQVPIYLYNSHKMGGFSFPFRHNGTGLRWGYGGENGVDTDGATAMSTNQKANILFESRDSTSNALVGWIDLTGTKPIAANTTGAAKLLGSVYLVLTSVTPQVIRFDSAFYPMAGGWVANNEVAILGGIEEFPKFVICQNSGSPCDIALPVNEVNGGNLPQKFELGQNMPNPFNPNTVIQFAVPRPAEVRVEVFNVLGQKVKTLANEFSKAGYKRVEWDGTDDNGSSVASGVYLYRMTSGDFSETKKMLLLK